MRPSLIVPVCALTITTLSAGCNAPPAQAPPAPAPAPAASGRILRLAAGLDPLVPAEARIEKIAGGFQFTEGPLWRPDGTLWFSDVVGNVVRSVTPDGAVKVLITNAGGVSSAPPGSFVGSNGITADRDGTVYMVQHTGRQIVRVGPDLKLATFLDKFEGKRFNSPNDLVFRSDGALYFTDPPFGLSKQDDDPAKELTFNGVFRYSHGRLAVIVKDLKRPNGIAFSPDEKTLYVSDSDTAHKVVMRYDVAPDGGVSNGRVLIDMTADTAAGVPDGMKVDERGNVYATGPGGIWVLAPDGTHLGTLQLPETPANCAWGDDGRSLYITAETSVYRIKLSVGGRR